MSELAYENCYGVINNHIIGKSTVDNRNLALVYDPDSVYNKGDHCIHEMKYWVCNTNNTTGAWNATKWTQTRVGNELTATDYISNVTWSKTVTSGYVKKVGNIVDVRMLFENLTLSNGGTLCTLPEAVRPTQHVNAPVYDYATGYQISGSAISILTTGVVGYYGSTALSNRRITFNVAYIV